jgi:hypothetical protein
MTYNRRPVFSVHPPCPSINPNRERRQGSSTRCASAALVVLMICLTLAGCRPSVGTVERLFAVLPKRTYDSIEFSNLVATRELLGLAVVNHRSPVADKLDYLSRMAPFTFSTEEYSFLVSDKTPLGFDPGDFYATVVARTPSYSVTAISGDFDTETIRQRLSEVGFRTEGYRGHTVYSLPWSDAPSAGGLFLTFANLTFVRDDVIVSTPTEDLLRDYLDRIEVGTLTDDKIVMGLVEGLKGESSFYLSRGVRSDELYGEDSLFIRSPADWGFPEYRLSPYTYFAFGIRPAADRQHQRITLLILYPDEASAKNDVALLARGLKEGKSLSRLVPFSSLFSVESVTSRGAVITAVLQSLDDFDVKLLIRLKDLPFLVY